MLAQRMLLLILLGILSSVGMSPSALAQTWRDSITFENGLEGSVSIARARVHDGVLSPCQILSN